MRRDLFAALPNQPGVYLLRCTVTRDTYVGCSLSIRERVRGHFSYACSNRIIRDLRREHGDESFTARVLCLCDKEQRLAYECEWIHKLQPTLNRGYSRSSNHSVVIPITTDIRRRLYWLQHHKGLPTPTHAAYHALIRGLLMHRKSAMPKL